MKKMIKGIIAIVFCIVLLSGCNYENNSYVILNIRDNIADTVRAGSYNMIINKKDGSGYVSFYNRYSPVFPNPVAIYTFNTDFPIIIKEVE